MKRTGSSKNALNLHFAQKSKECAKAFQVALARDLLAREVVNDLGAIICGDATIDYLILGDTGPVAEQYAASVYDRIQAQQPVWPFTNKKECPDPIKTQQQYSAAYEAYLQQKTPQALLAFYKDQYLVGRAYIASTAAYLMREEKDPDKREKERPYWKIFWKDLTTQKHATHAVRLTDQKFEALLRDERIRNALENGYRKIHTTGKTARDILITKFYALAYDQSKKYQTPEFTMDELIQEATIGIERATERYDYKRGILFTTYAKWWTRARLHRFTGLRYLRIPRELQEAAETLGLVERELRTKLQCEPGNTLLVKEMSKLGYNEKDATEALQIRRAREQPFSLDNEDAEGKCFYELSPDPRSTDPVDVISNSRFAENLRQAVARLDPNLRTVIELRYRLNGITPGKSTKDLVPLREVSELAEKKGSSQLLSRERIRQLEQEALIELRQIIESSPEFAYVQSKLEQE